VIPRCAQTEAQLHHILVFDSKVDRAAPNEAVDRQRRAREQDETEGDLRCHEYTARFH
jgi:hypothetical protein